MKTQIFCIGLS